MHSTSYIGELKLKHVNSRANQLQHLFFILALLSWFFNEVSPSNLFMHPLDILFFLDFSKVCSLSNTIPNIFLISLNFCLPKDLVMIFVNWWFLETFWSSISLGLHMLFNEVIVKLYVLSSNMHHKVLNNFDVMFILS